MNRTAIFFVSALLILVSTNAHNLYAFFWKAENATVVLNDCSENCELKGTLSVIPFDGSYRIETDQGEVVFDKDRIKMITYPVDAGVKTKLEE